MKTPELIEKVKAELVKNYEYDFASDWWYDDNIVLMQEVIQATATVLESKYIELERLKEYPMTHQGNCGKWQGYTLVEYRACTCGLDEILKPQTP